MMTLTETAGDHLTEILNNSDVPEGVAVRFVCRESEISLSLDNQKPGDETFEHQGKTVLLLDQHAAEYLDGTTVDAEQTGTGGKLFLSRKNKGST